MKELTERASDTRVTMTLFRCRALTLRGAGRLVKNVGGGEGKRRRKDFQMRDEEQNALVGDSKDQMARHGTTENNKALTLALVTEVQPAGERGDA